MKKQLHGLIIKEIKKHSTCEVEQKEFFASHALEIMKQLGWDDLDIDLDAYYDNAFRKNLDRFEEALKFVKSNFNQTFS